MLKTEHLVDISTHDYADYQYNHIHDSLDKEKKNRLFCRTVFNVPATHVQAENIFCCDVII
jgi:hypothetical protein